MSSQKNQKRESPLHSNRLSDRSPFSPEDPVWQQDGDCHSLGAEDSFNQVFGFGDRFSLSRPGWLQAQGNLLASASPVLELQVCTTIQLVKIIFEPGMVAHACNPNMQEDYCKFETGLVYI